MKNREHTFQAWVDRLIDRIVLPPMFTTAIDPAASDMARIGRRATLQARGMKFGLPDVFVCQGDVWDTAARGAAAWIELKRGTQVSAQQQATHDALRHAGQYVYTCSIMREVVDALRHAGFLLHRNAAGLAAEYEARVEASETAPRTPRAPRAAKPRPSPRDVARAERARRLP